jgi:hypothetical protein
MTVDQTEQHNLAAKQPEIVTALTSEWEAWWRACTGRNYSFTPMKFDD